MLAHSGYATGFNLKGLAQIARDVVSYYLFFSTVVYIGNLHLVIAYNVNVWKMSNWTITREKWS